MVTAEPIAAPPGGEISHVTTPDGADLRVAYWPALTHTPRATVVLLHGRTEFIEKYHEVIADLLARDCAVVTFDWRGQGLSQRLLPDSRYGHIDRYESYLADLDAVLGALGDRLAPPQILLAHSMGGHVALRHLGNGNGRWSGAVLSAPMVDIKLGQATRPLAHLVGRIGSGIGWQGRALPGRRRQAPWSDGRQEATARFAANPLTSDPRRYGHMLAWLEAEPALLVGPATVGWLNASLDSIRVLTDPRLAGAVATPVMVVSAELDQVVCNRAQAALVGRLREGELVTLAGSRHEPLMEREPIRAAFWRHWDAYLDDLI